MKSILGLFAVASSAFGILATANPVSAQYYYNPYGSRPSYSFTPSQSNIHYGVYRPQSSFSQSYGSSFGASRSSSNRGFGHSSGSYFGW
jgi:hypothetical protein